MVGTVVLLIQIALCCIGIYFSVAIYRLINHGNMWWLMSIGFAALLLNNIMTLVFVNEPWYLQARTVWSPLVVRVAFVLSTLRILQAAHKEHKEKLEAESRVNTMFSELRKLSEKKSSRKAKAE